MNNKSYAKVSWSIADIQALRPDWTEEECERWLISHERQIQNRLVELGQEVIEILLDE